MFAEPKKPVNFRQALRHFFTFRNLLQWFWRLGFTILITGLIIFFKMRVSAFSFQVPYLLVFFPVIISAYIGGFWSGIFAALLSALAVDYYLTPPLHQFNFYYGDTLYQTLVFLAESLIASWMVADLNKRRETEYRQRMWYETTLSSIGDAVIATNNQGRITFMNEVATQLTGWKLSAAFGKPLTRVFNIFNEQTGEKTENPVEKVLREKQITGPANHTVLINRQKQDIPIDDSAAPIMDQHDRIIGVVLIFREIDSKRAAQEKIRLSEERLRVALSNANIVVFNQDRKLQYTWINDSALGFNNDYVIGKKDHELFDKEVAEILTKVKKEVIRRNKGLKVEINLKTKGEEEYYEFAIEPLLNHLDEIVGITGVGTDITERKRLENRKDEFISIASHELRTPLTNIKGYFQILTRKINSSSDEKTKLYINKIDLYINRLNSLIGDLLDVTKIQAGRLPLKMEKINLDRVIDQSIENINLISEKHHVTREGINGQILIGDKQRLEQVMTNLLSNAVKYSPDADKVIVTTEKKNRKLVVSITDFGIGIPKNKQDRLFTRFYRVDPNAARFSGLGIGLYISSEIVKRHGGQIWVDSSSGQGSTFSFSLPIRSRI